MHALLERSDRVAFHTDLRAVLHALGDVVHRLDWVLSDWEAIGELTPARQALADIERGGARVVSGAALMAAVDEGEPLQVAWGVLSGFEPGTAPDPRALEPYPYADGNAALWEPGVTLQHPDARVEIVCWDSSATLVLSHDPAVTARFRASFPEAVDLEGYNRARTPAPRTRRIRWPLVTAALGVVAVLVASGYRLRIEPRRHVTVVAGGRVFELLSVGPQETRTGEPAPMRRVWRVQYLGHPADIGRFREDAVLLADVVIPQMDSAGLRSLVIVATYPVMTRWMPFTVSRTIEFTREGAAGRAR